MDGPGVTNLDLSIYKDFPINEEAKAEFRVEFFNITNTPQFGNFQGSLHRGGFMTINSTNAFTERNVRIGLRFEF